MTILLAISFGILYIRYIPVRGVRCLHTSNLIVDSIQIVDVRDYNQSYKDPTPEAINIPVAYMKRNYHEIPRLNIHVIASDHLEKNISIRYLRKKGFAVTGYTVNDCNCKQAQKQKTA